MNARKFFQVSATVLSLALGLGLLSVAFQKPSLAAQTPVAVDVAPVLVVGESDWTANPTDVIAEVVIEAAPSSTVARKAPSKASKAPSKVVASGAVLRELEQSTGVPERGFSHSKLATGGESVLYFPNGAP